MTPSWTMRFPREAFGAAVACTGQQVAAIVEAIDQTLPGTTWLAADIQTIGAQMLADRDPRPEIIGNAAQLISIARGVEQFESGVLAAVPSGCRTPRFREGGLWTEDEENAELGDALVEVRMFDTTYISVTSADSRLFGALQRRFDVPAD